MDRGIPTEEVLAEMRASDPPISYLVGTPNCYPTMVNSTWWRAAATFVTKERANASAP